MRYAEVILPVPLEGTFTYAIPDALAGSVRFGMRVVVPFGSRKTCVGIVADVHDDKPEGFAVRPVAAVPDDAPVLTREQYRLWRWISDYYMSPLGEVLKAALPTGLKETGTYKPRTETYVRLAPAYRSEEALTAALDKLARARKQHAALSEFLSLSHWDTIDDGTPRQQPEEVSRDELVNSAAVTNATVAALVARGMLQTYEREVGRLNNGGEPRPELVKALSQAQQQAREGIAAEFARHDVVLLHGVTSSGKTEIYINLIAEQLRQGRQVLYLLPEIALTVQMMSRLQRVFGNRLGIYHSGYSDAERVEMWRKQLSDTPYDIILGARSAVFLPFARLGLVIVDEEHDSSYKQQDPAPRYHARSAAVIMAKMSGAKVLLGTATPCIETYRNAVGGKFGLVRLATRYQDIQLPEVHVVDVKDLQHRKMMLGVFSPQLVEGIRGALQSGRQAILFQNRRGYAPMTECRSCGWVPHCQHCDVSLTLHRTLGKLTCHYCGATYDIPSVCPACGSTELAQRGYGTERIEAAVRELFPEARVARMDLDTTRTRNAFARIINDFAAGNTDILVGTQMISKGLDFERVAIVGILNADTMLNYPDFRAYEQAFMMMSQVSGRAGRKGERGTVVLQTRSAALPVIAQVASNDYASLYRSVIEERREFLYPPFCRLVYIFVRHRDEAVADHAADAMSVGLRRLFGSRLLGPDRPGVAMVKSMNIRKMVLKLETGIDLPRAKQCLADVRTRILSDRRYVSVQIYFDVDPM